MAILLWKCERFVLIVCPFVMWVVLHQSCTGKSVENVDINPITDESHMVNAEGTYVINHRQPIWVRNGYPGSVTDVAWYRWARDWVVRSPRFGLYRVLIHFVHETSTLYCS